MHSVLYTPHYLLACFSFVVAHSPMNDQENLFWTWTLMLFSQMKVFRQYHRFSHISPAAVNQSVAMHT